ncbi:MAG: cupin domain-containing protein [Candidatus Adiutrix sp.]|jgi:DNA-binding transcriptional MerR regulator/mannose-6-phosphate isomerase-like protein (cupin superfamily)|nr:cupin domain-containing protein [Candidatus Adiutrix sp.]
MDKKKAVSDDLKERNPAAEPDEIYFNINEVARQIEVVPATIRNWEKQNLFVARRSGNGYRIFSFGDLERLRKIKRLSKDESMGANAIQVIMSLDPAERSPRKSLAVSRKLISQKWREYRRERGYSLGQVAESVGISLSYLWKIENAQARASYGILEKLSEFYGESILYYIEDNLEENNLVARGSGEKIEIGLQGVSLEALGALSNFSLSPVIYTIEPQCGSRIAAAHRGEEFVYVLSGKMDFTVAGKQFGLSAGDSLCFRSSDSHSCRNPGKVVARMLWVLSMPRRQWREPGGRKDLAPGPGAPAGLPERP